MGRCEWRQRKANLAWNGKRRHKGQENGKQSQQRTAVLYQERICDRRGHALTVFR
jgi:hypothetical protein